MSTYLSGARDQQLVAALLIVGQHHGGRPVFPAVRNHDSAREESARARGADSERVRVLGGRRPCSHSLDGVTTGALVVAEPGSAMARRRDHLAYFLLAETLTSDRYRRFHPDRCRRRSQTCRQTSWCQPCDCGHAHSDDRSPPPGTAFRHLFLRRRALSLAPVLTSASVRLAVAGRRVHGELALRRKLRAAAVPVPGTAAAGPQAGPAAPAVSELREIA
jgi:hypothetical protein